MGHQGPAHASDVTSMSNRYTERALPTGDYDVDYLLDGAINPSGVGLNDCRAEPGCPAGGSWFRDAYLQRYNLSLRGGGETATYFVSGRYADEEGVVDPQGQVSYNLRVNVQFQPFDWIDVSVNNMYSRRSSTWIPNGNNASGLLLNVLRGDRGYTPGNDDSLVLVNDIESVIDQWVSSVSIGWAPTYSFSQRLNLGMDHSEADFLVEKRGQSRPPLAFLPL